MKNKLFKKVIAVVVTLALIAQMFTFSSFAADPVIDNRVVDLPTMTDWQNYFGEDVLNTENAGGVWGDKSVFLNADGFNAALEEGVADYNINMTENGKNFLVALSAIASNKSIVGYSALPTDTMFILDLSNSMSNASVTSMINATNASIKKLNELNLNNRIGVVVYAGTETGWNTGAFGLNSSASVLLPIGRYTGTGNNNDVFLTYSNDTVSVASGVLPNNQRPSKAANGATYIQAGVQLAVDEFNNVTDTVIASGPQAGTTRMPITVLMSDGAPTAATASFNNVGTSQFGTGSSSSTTSREVYLTQLSCAYIKAVMAEKYGRAPLLYTLGLNVGGSAYARAILDPQNAGDPYNTLWSNYVTASNGNASTIDQSIQINNYTSRTVTVPVVKNLEQNYVNEYFAASNDTSLINAFQQIVNQIIIQSKYYPTLVDDGKHHLNGYITFNDELGPFMQVKEIKGITVGGKLYPGSAIVKEIFNDTFGNISTGNLGNLNQDGLAFLQAVEARLGCDETQAGEVVSQALIDKQLFYDATTGEFSNYIGWYADQNGNFMGYWNGKDHTARPAGAVYANKSYGFMGKVGSAEEFNETDMLHISVQVRTHIDKDHNIVIYKIPATLIPTVNYEINFDGNSIETGSNFRMSVKGAKEAIRLVFEVGLRDDINRINVAEKIAEYNARVTDDQFTTYSNGVYNFYSNSWHEHAHTQDHLVDSHDSTWLEFKPSIENERYYYTYDAQIYVKVGTNYELITSDPTNDTTTEYYTRVAIFSTDSATDSSATLEYKYVHIHKDTIKLAQQREGYWYIPKDTVHRLLEDSAGHDYHTLKLYDDNGVPKDEDLNTAEKEHPTKTLNYSNYPAVVFLADGTVHADACLGNNGTFSITQAEGIKLSKTVDVAGIDAGQLFTFNITLTAPTGVTLASAYPVYDANGNYIKDVDVVGGVMTYELSAGQTVYFADIPVGTEYDVSEVILPNWSPSATNDWGTVAANAFNDVSFVNSHVIHGDLIIHKDVVLPQAVGNVTYNGEFELEISFEGTTPFTSVKVNGIDTNLDANNKLTGLKIKDNETILIGGIPDGTKVEVKEVNLPIGWTPTQSQNIDVIDSTEDMVVDLTNTYNVTSVYPVNINHTGVKNLLGRDWLDTDKFSFVIEYFNGTNWVAFNGEKEVLGTNTAKTFSFTNELQGFEFNRVGKYQFRVVEKATDIAGVNYDYIPKRFEVEVVNNFETGKLEIANVTTVTPMDATAQYPSGTAVEKVTVGGVDTYNITTTFNNRYSVIGVAEVAIEINKVLTNNTGVERDLSGFSFELYQLEGGNKVNVENLGTTDASGTITYVKSFGAELVGQTFTYYLAEVKGDEYGVIYDDTVHTITVEIKDNLNGTVSAHINGQATNEFSATFTNEYKLEAATVELEASKTMLGRDLTSQDEIFFEIYTSNQGFTTENKITEEKVVDGKVKFNITEATAGKKYYIIKEKATNIAGVTDDTAVYKVTVNVTKGNQDKLIYNIESILHNDLPASEIIFVNTYAPNPITHVISGKKALSGREIVDGEFEFTLKAEDGTLLETVKVANGEFNFEEIKFTRAGSYVFKVEEVALEDEAITYDNTVYTVKVDVTDDGLANLTKQVTITANENAATEIQFNNIYTAPLIPEPEPQPQPQPQPDIETETETEPEPNPNPPMGDAANLFMWLAIAFISGGLVIATGLMGKKKEEAR